MLETSKNIKDINILKINLINYLGEVIDLTSLFVQFNIYESLFTPCLTGDIIIDDGVNLLNTFPIICQEKLIISYANPRLEPKELEFNVIGVDHIKNSVNNDKVQSYMIHFASPEIIKNDLTTISKCLKGKVDDIVLDIMLKEWGLNYKKGYNVEKSDSYINFISPYWNPFQIIQYLAERSIPENRNFPTYLFYQDFNNYNFVSYDSMVEKDVKETFFYAPANLFTSYNTNEKSRNVNRYEISNYLNILNLIENKVLCGQYIEIDLTNKKYNTNKYDYLQSFEKYPKLYNNEIIPKNNLDQFKYNEESCEIDVLYNYFDDKDMKKFNKWYLYRRSWMKQIQSLKITLETTENISRSVGDLVEFNIPSRERFENGMKYADYITGKFIISKIRHTIGCDSKGIASIELIKDTFSKKLPEGKINE